MTWAQLGDIIPTGSSQKIHSSKQQAASAGRLRRACLCSIWHDEKSTIRSSRGSMTTGGPGRGYSFSWPPCAGCHSVFRYKMAVTRRASTCRHHVGAIVEWDGRGARCMKQSAPGQVMSSMHAKGTRTCGVTADFEVVWR